MVTMWGGRHTRGGGGGASSKWLVLLCIGSFCFGMFVTNRMWTIPDSREETEIHSRKEHQEQHLQLVNDCEKKSKETNVQPKDILSQVTKTHDAIKTLDKTISTLEMELAAARAAQATSLNGSPVFVKPVGEKSEERQKAFLVIGINTAFSSRKRRDSVRETWMPRGEKLRQIEQEKGIVIRFAIGHRGDFRPCYRCRGCSTSGFFEAEPH